jgi:hypothetical protein
MRFATIVTTVRCHEPEEEKVAKLIIRGLLFMARRHRTLDIGQTMKVCGNAAFSRRQCYAVGVISHSRRSKGDPIPGLKKIKR